jgi:DNA-binding transcriptional regulator YiaG
MAQSTITQSQPRFADEHPSFGCHLRHVRHQLGGKQLWLSHAIRCTASAISLWESGTRLPNPESLSRMLSFLAESGAPMPALHALHIAWQREIAERWLTPHPVDARRSRSVKSANVR